MADYLKGLAELTVRVGIDLQPGQDVFVYVWDPAQAEVARAVTEAAYAAGARYVSVVYWDGPAKASRIRHATDDSLGFVPDWFRRTVTEAIERKGAVISIFGDPDPSVFDGVDHARLGRDLMPFIPELHDLVASREVNWTCIPGPNAGWAERLFGEPDVDRLWAALAPILRLDTTDPVEAWRTHVEALSERARLLKSGASTRSASRDPEPSSRSGSFAVTAGCMPASPRRTARGRSSTSRPKRCSRPRTATVSREPSARHGPSCSGSERWSKACGSASRPGGRSRSTPT